MPEATVPEAAEEENADTVLPTWAAPPLPPWEVARAGLHEALQVLEQKEEMAEQKEEETLFKKVLEEMKPLPGRIRSLLKPPLTTDGERRWLAFIEMELSGFCRSLTLRPPRECGGHPHKVEWMQGLDQQAGAIWKLLGHYDQR